jgi:phosphatidylserine decarboxylase
VAIGTSFWTSSIGLISLSWVIFALVLFVYFERRPKCPPLPNALVCPMSGHVVSVDSCWDPWSNRTSQRIRINVSLPRVGVVWAPTEGKIEDYWTKAAAFDGPPGKPGKDDSPNCYAILIRTDEKQDALLSLSSTRSISRFKLDVGPGNRVGQGRRLGFAYFVSYIDLLLDPRDSSEVQVGDKVLGGESVLATFAERAG